MPAPSQDQTRIVVDPVVVQRLDSTLPAGMSRTSWANYLIQVGLSSVSCPNLPAASE